MDAMGDLFKRYGRFSFWQYMNFPQNSKIGTVQQYDQIGDPVVKFIDRAIPLIHEMNPTMWKLQKIPAELKVDSELKTIIGELEALSSSNIDGYEKTIRGHEAKIQLLNILFQYISPYEKSLTKTKAALHQIRTIKESINENRDKFKKEFLREVDKIQDITDRELDEIKTEMERIIEFVNLIQKYIDNTRLFFRYLRTFQLHKRRIDRQNIEGNGISAIQETISSIEGVIGTITKAQDPIHKAKQELGEKYEETWGEGETRETALPTVKTWHFPGEVDVGAESDKLCSHLRTLKSIQSFYTSLEVRDPGPILNLLDTGEPVTNDIQGLLVKLSLIDEVLSITGKLMESQVGLIESSHESTKSRLNNDKNRNGIEGMVGEIKQIPEKLSKLHNTVKIYIQLTQIVLKTIETLDKMKTKATSLTKANDFIGNLRNNVESAITELKDVYLNTVYMPNIREKMRMYNINFATNELKEYFKNLEGDVRSIRGIENKLDISTTKLQDHQKILGDIYREITYTTSQLIDLVYGTRSNGSIANALSGANNERIQRSKEIIGHLTGARSKIIKLMKYLCEVQYYICCTKLKLGCFVKSLETRVRWIGEGIQNVESSIESVIICFLQCSNKRITNNTKESTKRMLTGGGQVNNYEIPKQFLRCLESMGRKYNIW